MATAVGSSRLRKAAAGSAGEPSSGGRRPGGGGSLSAAKLSGKSTSKDSVTTDKFSKQVKKESVGGSKGAKSRRRPPRRRRKKRTHVAVDESASFEKTPKCLVFSRGVRSGSSVHSLLADLRTVMLPWCSTKLRTSRTHTLKDFLSAAGTLKLSHLQIVSQTLSKQPQAPRPPQGDDTGRRRPPPSEAHVRLDYGSGRVYWKICGVPAGPTVTFEVLEYTICKDVKKSQKRPRASTHDFKTAPLAVLNGFSTTPKGGGIASQQKQRKTADDLSAQSRSAMEIMRRILTNMFPTIDVQAVKVGDCRRVVLFNHFIGLKNRTGADLAGLSEEEGTSWADSLRSQQREGESEEGGHFVDFRQYAVLKRLAGTSRTVRKLIDSGKAASVRHLVDIGNNRDISDYILYNKKRRSTDASASCGYATSDSEFEGATEVRVPRDLPSSSRIARRSSDHNTTTAAPTLLHPENSDAAEADDNGGPNVDSKSEDSGKKVAIGLKELGPRMLLRLVKIEEETCAGAVVYHEFICKTPEEAKKLELKSDELKRKRKEVLHEVMARGSDDSSTTAVAEENDQDGSPPQLTC